MRIGLSTKKVHGKLMFRAANFELLLLAMCMRPESCSGTSEPSNLHNLVLRAATEPFSGASESKIRALSRGNVHEA